MANDDGTSYFKKVKDDTPRVNNLLAGGLLDRKPELHATVPPGSFAGSTCDQNHDYTAELTAVDHGLMDNFPAATGVGDPARRKTEHLATTAIKRVL